MVGSSTGKTLRLYQKRESTYDTAATGDYLIMPFIAPDLGVAQENEANPSIGNGSDPVAPLRGVLDGNGSLSVPMDARYIGVHLAALLGDPVTTHPDPEYQHVFSSGKTDQPTSQSMEIAHLGLATDKFALNTGVLYSGLNVSFKRSGFVETKFDVIGTNEVWSGSTGAGTPGTLVEATVKYFSHLTGTIKRNGVAIGNILSGDFTFNSGLDPLEVVANSGKIGGADRTEASLLVNLQARFRDTVLLDDAVAGTPMAIEWALTNSSTEKIVWSMPLVTFARPKVPVSGPSGVNVTLKGTGAANAGNKMLTATLTNDYAGTVYAA